MGKLGRQFDKKIVVKLSNVLIREGWLVVGREQLVDEFRVGTIALEHHVGLDVASGVHPC